MHQTQRGPAETAPTSAAAGAAASDASHSTILELHDARHSLLPLACRAALLGNADNVVELV